MFRFSFLIAALFVASLNSALANSDSTVYARDQIRSISLSDYVYLALAESEQMLDINEQLFLSKLDLQSAEYKFDSRFVPLASIGSGDGGGTQSAGVEWNKLTTYGTKFSAGVTGGLSGEDETRTATSNTYIQVSQDLFRGWGQKYNRSSLTIAEFNQDKKNLSLQKARQMVIKTAVQKFYQALLAEKIVESAYRSYQRATENLEVSKSRQTVGLVSKSDVYRANIALLNSESSYKDQQKLYTTRIEELHEYVRLFEIGHLKPEDKITRFSPVVPEKWGDEILQHNFDWISYQIDKKIGSLNLYKAEQDLNPDVSLRLKYGVTTSGQSFNDDDTTSDPYWSVQLHLNSTFDLFSEKQSLAREKIAKARLQRSGESLKRKIYRNIRENINSLKAEDRRLQISDQKMEQSEKAFELARIRYERGLINNLELIEAENDLYSSELENLQAQVGYNLASVDLAFSLSTLTEEWLEQTLNPQEPSSIENK